MSKSVPDLGQLCIITHDFEFVIVVLVGKKLSDLLI